MRVSGTPKLYFCADMEVIQTHPEEHSKGDLTEFLEHEFSINLLFSSISNS